MSRPSSLRNESRKVYGVGINDSDHQVQVYKKGYICPIYLKWRNMLQRCYDTKYTRGYDGCVVCKHWHHFSNFEKWVLSLGIENISNLHLDKDILGDGNLYSESTCCFLHPIVNTFITNSLRGETKGITPVLRKDGVTVYNVQVRNPLTKKREYLGRVFYANEGINLWVSRKLEILQELYSRGYILQESVYLNLKEKIQSFCRETS